MQQGFQKKCIFLHYILPSLLVLIQTSAYSADYYNGSKIYNRHCVNCHGSTGMGEVPDAPNFTRGEGIMKPDSQLIRHLQIGSGPAPAFENILSEREMLDVITYIRSLY
ncbi:cytochrome c6 [bacterium BMS3Bbin11]|nr:cytochrome c6 [bacterium BMS3Abin11]GBE46038.1 cytochrome c6 [bacterium BMS3Bbin11]HDH09206.1 cytochrome c [Gammaproteobacteria bacterium]HDH16653.1 cytochrome c [Gammaproteobacteria bacterium]HDZ79022.1 cytochrome c [Gammaproteobacteria bacterium]